MDQAIIDHAEGTVTVEMSLGDWVWFCELLSEIKNEAQQTESDQYLLNDLNRALSVLSTFENAIG